MSRLWPWRRRRREAELDEEIAGHLAMAARERESRGERSEEAAYAAQREFGNRTLVREVTRRTWSGAWLSGVAGDVALALRHLRRSPAFTAAVVLTLALGVGLNAAVFAAAHWLVLRPVPGVLHPDRVALIEIRDPEGHTRAVSYPDLDDLRQRIPALFSLAGYTGAAPVAVFVNGRTPAYAEASFVSADFFRVLGTRFVLGRALTARDQQEIAPVTNVVISHRLWQGAFQGDPGVIGRSLTVNSVPARVIGVAAAGFHGPELLSDVDLWVPGSALLAVAHLGIAVPVLRERASQYFTGLVGRLAPSPQSAGRVRAQLESALASLRTAYPLEDGHLTSPVVYGGLGAPTSSRDAVGSAVRTLGAIAGLVLLIAVLNVGNLFLLRGLGRRTELAVRQALGAGGGRLLRLQLTESLVVGALAVAPAVLLCVWITHLFYGTVLPGGGAWSAIPEVTHIPLHRAVIAFAVALALAAGIVAAFVPALGSRRPDLAMALRAAPAGPQRSGGRLYNRLATAQVGLSLCLLIVTLLMVATLRRLRAVNVGFDARRVSAYLVYPAYAGFTAQQGEVLLGEAVARVRALPGVEAAAWGAEVPFGAAIGCRLRAVGSTPGVGAATCTSAFVSPDYFRTLGIPLLAGRTFDDAEMFWTLRGPERHVILSASLARRIFGSVEGAVGREVSDGLRAAVRVIGVVGDSRWASLVSQGPGPPYYNTLASFSAKGSVLFVRSRMAGPALHRAVQSAVNDVAPTLPVLDLGRLQEHVDQSIWEDRLLGRVLSVFAALAVALAVVGVYVVVAFWVGARTQELGIRMALGARPRQVVVSVVKRSLVVGGAGLLLGLAGGAALSRLVASRLYGVGALQPQVYGLAALLLFAAVLLASAAPAIRAARVDPMRSLRYE